MQNSQEQEPSSIQLARWLRLENLHIMPLSLKKAAGWHERLAVAGWLLLAAGWLLLPAGASHAMPAKTLSPEFMYE